MNSIYGPGKIEGCNQFSLEKIHYKINEMRLKFMVLEFTKLQIFAKYQGPPQN